MGVVDLRPKPFDGVVVKRQRDPRLTARRRDDCPALARTEIVGLGHDSPCVLSALGGVRLGRGDQADTPGRWVAVDDHQHAPERIAADGYEALLRMRTILRRDLVGVELNRDGIGKLDAMFAPIGALLVRVPL